MLISISLLFLFPYPNLFIIGYLLCGISDIMDGYLARRYKWETRLGEQLDSFSDTVFSGVIIYMLIAYTDMIDTQWAIIGIAIVMILRIINFIITKVKFKTWGAIHTLANKATGILLYLYMPAVIIYNTVLFVPGIALCFIALVSSIEEMIILLTSKQYNANQKSIFRI